MLAVGCDLAAALADRRCSPLRHAAAAASSLRMSTTTPRNYRRRLVVRAAVNIPPDVLVHPKTIEHDQWGMKYDKDKKVILWFLVTGAEESKVQDEVEVNLPVGSNVLTIKKKTKTANPDELLDVRLLLTTDYDMEGIKVEKGTKATDGNKVRLEVTIIQKNTPFYISIN